MENANKMQPAKIDWDKERSEPGWKTNERFVNRGSTGLERCQQLSDIFEKRKTAILNHIRSVHTKNLQSVSMDEINEFQKTHKSVFSGQGALNTASAAVKGPAPSGNTELKNKLNSLKGKKTDDFEILWRGNKNGDVN